MTFYVLYVHFNLGDKCL